MKRKKRAMSVPVPVKIDSRICFAIAYFTSEKDATVFAKDVERQGITYNGGWFHGKPCGRETTWDYTDATLGPLFGVTY